VEHQIPLTEYPWDNQDSLDKLDEAALRNFVDDTNGSGPPNNKAGNYSESANDVALRFGIHSTTKHYQKPDSLEI
jgi:hypothetical protein